MKKVKKTVKKTTKPNLKGVSAMVFILKGKANQKELQMLFNKAKKHFA